MLNRDLLKRILVLSLGANFQAQTGDDGALFVKIGAAGAAALGGLYVWQKHSANSDLQAAFDRLDRAKRDSEHHATAAGINAPLDYEAEDRRIVTEFSSRPTAFSGFISGIVVHKVAIDAIRAQTDKDVSKYEQSKKEQAMRFVESGRNLSLENKNRSKAIASRLSFYSSRTHLLDLDRYLKSEPTYEYRKLVDGVAQGGMSQSAMENIVRTSASLQLLPFIEAAKSLKARQVSYATAIHALDLSHVETSISRTYINHAQIEHEKLHNAEGAVATHQCHEQDLKKQIAMRRAEDESKARQAAEHAAASVDRARADSIAREASARVEAEREKGRAEIRKAQAAEEMARRQQELAEAQTRANVLASRRLQEEREREYASLKIQIENPNLSYHERQAIQRRINILQNEGLVRAFASFFGKDY